MSKILRGTETEPESKHGTITSYVIGFVLSLVFTLIPYYLVVNKSLRGNSLLATIIGFAVAQLVIQVVFFLHLGRERKPRFNLFFLVATIGIILLVVVGSIWIMNHLHYNMSAKNITDKVVADEAVHQVDGQQVGTCPGKAGTNHMVELKNNAANPRHVNAKLCDTLTIVNLDSVTRELNFGEYEKPDTYAGETGKALRPRRNMVLTLTEPGTYKFHDHLPGGASGEFTVTP